MSVHYAQDHYELEPPGTTGSLTELIFRRSFGGDIALDTPSCGSLSFDDLSRQIEYTGAALRARGVTRTDVIATVLPNGPLMACVFLGVSAHSACAPLNPQLGPAQIRSCLSRLSPAAIIVSADADPSARSIARDLHVPVFDVESQPDAQAAWFRFKGIESRQERVENIAGGDAVALILHTSGTTSQPKWVPLTHRNLCSSASAIADTLALKPTDVCLNVMPLFHVHGLVAGILAPLCAGGTVVCAAEFDSEQFLRCLAECRPTWYSAVPTIHQAVVTAARRLPGRPDHDLRLIRSASAALPPRLMAELESVFGVPVIESYGMTEAANQIASNPLPPAVRKPGSVGLPAGTEMRIMDDRGHVLPAGEIGEIVVHGPCLTTGYRDDFKANEGTFTDGWFRTGDQGYVDPDGYCFITGRLKEMINRGGESISPREIDETLMEHPAVMQAVAFAVPHSTLGEDIAVAVVLRSGSTVSETELRRFALERLAPASVPSRVLTVASIPTGPVGKPQRLRLHEALQDLLRNRHIEPRTDIERTVVDVIEAVLKTGPVGVTDNFFALGGDSLKATRVLVDLGTEYRVELPAVSLFRNPSAEELSLEITRLLGEDSGRLEALLENIESMSDEEVRRQLR